jgi:hypothetical protein
VCGGGAEIAAATSIVTRTLEQQLEKHAVPPSTAEATAEDRRRICTQVAPDAPPTPLLMLLAGAT